MRSTTTKSKVTITRRGPFLEVAPATELLGHLRVEVPKVVGESGSEYGTPAQALFKVHRSDTGTLRARVWAGLETVIRGVYKSASIPVTASGDERSAVASLRYTGALTDPSVVSFVAGGGGLVRYDDQSVEVLWVIVQICLAFDTARFVLIVGTKKDAVDLGHLLLRHGITPAVTDDGKVFDIRQRVVVTLLGQMGCVELHKDEVVLVTDALYSTLEDPLTAELAPRSQRPHRNTSPESDRATRTPCRRR
ncbi:MAG: hypothetical protein C0467_09045 [Planctomycetaceae bacterium]|nr:hypothetical protein [Planctomycetaceae bacterium]